MDGDLAERPQVRSFCEQEPGEERDGRAEEGSVEEEGQFTASRVLEQTDSVDDGTCGLEESSRLAQVRRAPRAFS